MKVRASRAALALYLVTSLAGQGWAAPAPKKVADGPSNHLKCDGRPNNTTAGESAARLLGAVTLLGIFAPAAETADASKRLFGAEGVAACDALLVQGEAGEGHIPRRIELHLARALHRIEAKDYQGAIADVKALEDEHAALSSAPEWKLGTGQSVGHVEALALAGRGDWQAAADRALSLAETAPYDLIATARVLKLVALSGRYGEREQAYYDRLARLAPVGLSLRAGARQQARDYRGAASDIDLLVDIVRSYAEKEEPSAFAAQSAMLWYLAGDRAQGAAREAEARSFIDKQTAAGKTPAAAIEQLDFANIVKFADAGDLRQARLLFAGRTKWTAPTAFALAHLAERLRAEAKPDEQIGLLAKSPADFVREWRETELALVNAAGEKGEKRFTWLATPVSRAGFDRFGTHLWKDGKSRYVAKKPNEKVKTWTVNTMRDGYGPESSYALLLASALEAKKRGHSHFALHPIQIGLGINQIRTGAPDGKLLHEAVSFDADRVIADLKPLLPVPAKK